VTEVEVWHPTDKALDWFWTVSLDEPPTWKGFVLEYLIDEGGPSTTDELNEGKGFRVSRRLLERELEKLEKQGWVTSEVVSVKDRPPRTLEDISIGSYSRQLQLSRDERNPIEYSWLRYKQGSQIPGEIEFALGAPPGAFEGVEMQFPGVETYRDLPQHWGTEDKDFPYYPDKLLGT